MKTAFSMMDSWRKNYVKVYRKGACPKARRPFIRVKQTTCKLEGDELRVSITPRSFVHFDLSKRYFRIPKEVSSSVIAESQSSPQPGYTCQHTYLMRELNQ